jgi:hypothetical protein
VAVRLPSTRIVSREGINATQTFFERHGCVFQEVAQQNDFGKDANVDVVQGRVVTFLCVALQIKSGGSYRAANGNYVIPLDSHAETWRRSTVPVFGIVYDPADQALRWADLTGYLRTHPEQDSGSVPVSRNSLLNDLTLCSDLIPALSGYSTGGAIELNLLSPGDLQPDAVFDAWGLGRHDARYLLLLRRLVLELDPLATRNAIYVLGHATPHPDIFWTEDNWILPEIKTRVRKSFHWSPEEIAHMVRVIEPEEWGRGTLGQSFDMMVYEDPKGMSVLNQSMALLIESDPEFAVRVATLILIRSEDQRHELSLMVREYPGLMSISWFREIAATIEQFGYVSLY